MWCKPQQKQVPVPAHIPAPLKDAPQESSPYFCLCLGSKPEPDLRTKQEPKLKSTEKVSAPKLSIARPHDREQCKEPGTAKVLLHHRKYSIVIPIVNPSL